MAVRHTVEKTVAQMTTDEIFEHLTMDRHRTYDDALRIVERITSKEVGTWDWDALQTAACFGTHEQDVGVGAQS